MYLSRKQSLIASKTFSEYAELAWLAAIFKPTQKTLLLGVQIGVSSQYLAVTVLDGIVVANAQL